MLATVFAVTVRYRRPILTISVVLAVVLAAGRRLSPVLDAILVGVSFVAVMVLLLLSLLGLRGRRPAGLLVKPAVPALAVAPNTSYIYLAMGLTFLGSLLLGSGDEPRYLVIPYLVLVGVNVAFAWGGDSIELQPDGIHRRLFLGSLSVPWDALAPGTPSRPPVDASVLTLAYARPELVRRRGVVPSQRLSIADIHAWFIADVIRHYVDHPQHRAAIGEQVEYERLWQALTYSSTRLGQTQDS
ncbi:hypothetical protein AB0D32_29585 [Micromonospora sp. NPDC048170]|uniref:hypothetical protein n=1 Tax=Micromonospora sp. NPDC048170 TaxID=3154819 RepID=UPI00340214BA